MERHAEQSTRGTRGLWTELRFWAEPDVPGGPEKERKTGELCMVFSSAAFHIKVIHMF